MAAARQPVGGVEDLFGALESAQGGTIELSVMRGAEERTIHVALGDTSAG